MVCFPPSVFMVCKLFTPLSLVLLLLLRTCILKERRGFLSPCEMSRALIGQGTLYCGSPWWRLIATWVGPQTWHLLLPLLWIPIKKYALPFCFWGNLSECVLDGACVSGSRPSFLFLSVLTGLKSYWLQAWVECNWYFRLKRAAFVEFVLKKSVLSCVFACLRVCLHLITVPPLRLFWSQGSFF